MAARSAIAFAFCVLTISALLSCSSAAFDPQAFRSRDLQLADGSSASWGELRGSKATVLITLDPECPFSQDYAPVIDSLQERFHSDGVVFVGLYPTTFIAADSAARFARLNDLDFPQVMDPDCALAIALAARVTPECFMLDAGDELVYRGAIDDWAVRAGRHKLRATQHYLADALQALLAGKTGAEREVTAKGCIVECGADL